MARFDEKVYLCRASRPVRLYRSVYDASDCATILCPDQIFTSRKQYIRDHVTFYHITESDSDVPVGYWCTGNVLQTIPVDVAPTQEPTMTTDGSITQTTDLEVNAHGAVIYKNPTGDRTVPCDLPFGTQILSDQQVSVVMNGMPEMRYHIASLTGEDQSLVGGWIAANRAIRVVPTVATADLAAIPMPMTAVPSAPEGGGGGTGGGGNTANNPTSVVVPTNTGSGTELTLPPDTDTSGDDAGLTADDEAQEVIITTSNYNDEDFMRKMYESYGMEYFGSSESSLMNTPIGRMIFVHGMPFQFTHITDRRGHSTKSKGQADDEFVTTAASGGGADMYGRTFAKEIASNMPIAVMVPGKPKFLTNVKSGLFRGKDGSNETMAGFIPSFGASDSELGNALAGAVESIQGDYQYYSLEVAVEDYFQYVNSCAHSSARFMGLGKTLYRGVALENFDWQKYNSSEDQEYGMFEEIVGLSGGVSFAYDPTGAVTDTISNSTGESKFASFFNNINSQAREIEFIMGFSGAEAYKVIDSANFVGEAQSAMKGGLFGGIESVVDRVGTWLKNSLHGMNMRFPEIWNESQHSRGYDIEMHFIAPYATSFCKYRYVLIPFYHIFCLASPTSDTNVSQYSAPFIMRAYSKGYFNVEMGIIENLMWKRFGDGDMISEDGIPTQIDVSITFKDLYHVLAMTNMYKTGVDGTSGMDNVQNFLNNTGLVDLIGTLSGVNMNRISLKDRLAMWASTSMDAWGSLGGNFMRHIQGRVRSVVENVLYGV